MRHSLTQPTRRPAARGLLAGTIHLFHGASPHRAGWCVMALLIASTSLGCHDGPLYGLKTVNPFYVSGQWKNDEALAESDFVRRKKLLEVANSIESLPESEQIAWKDRLEKIIDEDRNAEMRRLAVLTSSRISDPSALKLVERGLDDESQKVRMEACRALGGKDSEEAARLLAATVGTESDQDVKHAAMVALANHTNTIAVDSLRNVLKNRNPATRAVAINSLRSVTGQDHGNDPQVWIAALDAQKSELNTTTPGILGGGGDAKIAEQPGTTGGTLR